MADPFKPPRQFKAAPSNKSKGILDDFAIRKSIASREGYFNSINWNAGTTGSVLFMANNLIAQDNANLYWDNVAKQLELTKIKLTAAGTAAIPALKFNDRNTGIYSGGSNIISFSTDGTHKMSILENGNVGIGTADPLDMLHIRPVSFAANQDGGIRFSDTGDNWNGRVALKSDALGIPRIAIDIQGDETLSVVSLGGGSVGIGTASPQHKLDIVAGGTNQLRLSNVVTDATNKNSYILGRHYTNSEESISWLVGTSGNGESTVRIGGGSGAWNAVEEIRFYTAADDTTLTGTQRMTIDKAGLVGIDTATPTTQFSVKEKAGISPIGGIMIKLTNKTGSNSVQGQLVHADTSTNDAVKLTIADGEECIGVFLEGGVSDGSEAWIVISGIADVAMEDNTTATRGNWVRTSITEAGYADATNALPPSPAAFTHFNEIGNCIETVTAGGEGTHILARCVLHFN